MHNADFLGTYVLRDKERQEAMPVHNDSGMWQAWLSPGGGILVRALSRDYQPFGATYPMSREIFFSLLLPLAPEAGACPENQAQAQTQTQTDAGTAPSQTPAQTDAGTAQDQELPDLLDMWYNQASSPAPEAETPQAARTTALSPAQLKEREQRLRADFAALVAQMDEQPEPDLDAAVAAVLAERLPPSAEQKFMFTDFGRALRRKGRHALSLAAHLRALACAPDDEHVLFNVARSQYEAGHTAEAAASLEKAVRAAPDFREAAHFLQFLHGSSKKGSAPAS